jgi:hypothetical protein
VIEYKRVEGWVQSRRARPVVRKRDERTYLEQKHSCPSCQRR